MSLVEFNTEFIPAFVNADAFMQASRLRSDH
jgi:hypothetical protein